MRASFIQEPELEFGAGTHIDIRFGLLNYGPLDSSSPVGPKRVRLGIVGTPESVAGLSSWINRCRDGILAKPSKRPNLFPRFPGFGHDAGMPTDIVLDDRLNRAIPPAQFDPLCRAAPTYETFAAIAQLYMQELQYLEDKREVDVCVCAYPSGLVDFLEQNTESAVDSEDESGDTEARAPASVEWDLHDLLKAQAMRYGAPLQIVRPATYGGQRRARSKGTGVHERTLQDEATRAWNLYVALYYKAGGVPWRLVRDPSALACCYVGISFYKALRQPGTPHQHGTSLQRERSGHHPARGACARIQAGQERASRTRGRLRPVEERPADLPAGTR